MLFFFSISQIFRQHDLYLISIFYAKKSVRGFDHIKCTLKKIFQLDITICIQYTLNDQKFHPRKKFNYINYTFSKSKQL